MVVIKILLSYDEDHRDLSIRGCKCLGGLLEDYFVSFYLHRKWALTEPEKFVERFR